MLNFSSVSGKKLLFTLFPQHNKENKGILFLSLQNNGYRPYAAYNQDIAQEFFPLRDNIFLANVKSSFFPETELKFSIFCNQPNNHGWQTKWVCVHWWIRWRENSNSCKAKVRETSDSAKGQAEVGLDPEAPRNPNPQPEPYTPLFNHNRTPPPGTFFSSSNPSSGEPLPARQSRGHKNLRFPKTRTLL